MKKYQINYKLFGNIIIEADNLGEAINKLENYSKDNLLKGVDGDAVFIGGCEVCKE